MNSTQSPTTTSTTPKSTNCALCLRPQLYLEGQENGDRGIIGALHRDWHKLYGLLDSLPETYDIELELALQPIDMGPPKLKADGSCDY